MIGRVSSAIIILLGLSQFGKVLGQSLRPPCRDDPLFRFGAYEWKGRKIIRTCEWLTENDRLTETRRSKWCNRDIEASYGTVYSIREKCPEACFACPEAPTVPADCVNSPVFWHDSTGVEYDCGFYVKRNCEMWGNSFPKYGKTASEACCSCGGGCVDNRRFRDSRGRSCAWYAANASRCKTHGGRFRNKNGDVANDACCACNGRSNP